MVLYSTYCSLSWIPAKSGGEHTVNNSRGQKEKAPESDSHRGFGQEGSCFFCKGWGRSLFYVKNIPKIKPPLSSQALLLFRYVLLYLLDWIACSVILAMAGTVTDGHLVLMSSSFRKWTRDKCFFWFHNLDPFGLNVVLYSIAERSFYCQGIKTLDQLTIGASVCSWIN